MRETSGRLWADTIQELRYAIKTFRTAVCVKREVREFFDERPGDQEEVDLEGASGEGSGGFG